MVNENESRYRVIDFSRYRKLQEIRQPGRLSVRNQRVTKCRFTNTIAGIAEGVQSVSCAAQEKNPYANGAEAAVWRGSCRASPSNPDPPPQDAADVPEGIVRRAGISIEGKR